MRCPFPGMDPYIERAEIWPDFHDRLVVRICEELQPLLRPRYVAMTEERLYVVESERPIRPDVTIARSTTRESATAQVAVMEPDTPAVFEFWREEIQEPLIHIVEPAANNRIVTAIEVLSPSNKAPGAGRDSYLKKREEFWNSGTNLVEIDLLRQGESTVRLSAERLASLKAWTYLVAVTRRFPSRQEVYAIPLMRHLPRIAIPLASGDADATFDLQAAFARCWDAGPYPELLKYDGSPPSNLTDEERRWCTEILRSSKLA